MQAQQPGRGSALPAASYDPAEKPQQQHQQQQQHHGGASNNGLGSGPAALGPPPMSYHQVPQVVVVGVVAETGPRPQQCPPLHQHHQHTAYHQQYPPYSQSPPPSNAAYAPTSRYAPQQPPHPYSPPAPILMMPARVDADPANSRAPYLPGMLRADFTIGVCGFNDARVQPNQTVVNALFCTHCTMARQLNRIADNGTSPLHPLCALAVGCDIAWLIIPFFLPYGFAGSIINATCLLNGYLRQKIRRKYDIQSSTIADYLVSWVCPFCAVCQQQTEMKLAGEDPTAFCENSPHSPQRMH